MTAHILNRRTAGRPATIVLTIISLLLCSQPAVAQTQKDEWILVQKSDELGDIVVYTSHDAVKIANPSWGYQVLAKAPDWKVHCFRPVEKTEWTGELENFSGAMINSPFRDGGIPSAPVFPLGKGVMKGLKYTRYAESRQSLKWVYGADDIPVSARAAEFLGRVHHIPNCGLVPIYRVDYKTPDSKDGRTKSSWLALDVGKDLRTGMVIQVSTSSWKKLPFNAADFQLPQGLKRVNQLSEVAMSPLQKRSMTEVFDGMGFASDQGCIDKKPAANFKQPETQKRPAPRKNSP